MSTRWIRGLRRMTCAAALLCCSGCSMLQVTRVWMSDPSSPLPPTQAGVNDASRMVANQAEVIVVPSDLQQANAQISQTIQRAVHEHRTVSVSGARHSMGGHTFTQGGLVLDVLALDHLELDESRRLLRAGAGALWSKVIPFLDKRGLSVAVMQSNNDFSVGGSVSVNCHGWQNDSPPIASTVEGLTLITADGMTRHCSRHENAELFSMALGGYGLVGVITEVELRVVPNEFYRPRAQVTNAARYLETYRRMAKEHTGMAYGRISLSPKRYLNEAIVTALERQPQPRRADHTLRAVTPWQKSLSRMKRSVFRACAQHPENHELRWKLENSVGENGHAVISRNQILNESSLWFANRNPAIAEILQEVFVPVERLDEFLRDARIILRLERELELLNITVRNVTPDHDSLLCYTRGEVFGLVMLFNHPRTPAGDHMVAALNRKLIDAALNAGGSYYLPYRPHATRSQFLRSYPQAPRFAQLKRKYDPTGVFDNEFWRKYGRGL